jgi:hypothetical protein
MAWTLLSLLSVETKGREQPTVGRIVLFVKKFLT